MKVLKLLTELGIDLEKHAGRGLAVHTPIDGSKIASLGIDTPAAVNAKIENAAEAFRTWRDVPAPKRGELIRLFGDELRRHKEPLAMLVTVECGKILAEGRGEAQEMIDICDFAVGISRQLHGLTIASERPRHAMQETWHPLGPVGVISAFNFPVAVWAWNFALAIICGDPVIWKPSEKTPLCALACKAIFDKALRRYARGGGGAPDNLLQIIPGDAAAGECLVADPRIALVSATGSTRMGRAVAPKIAARFGKSLLELGGNNAVIVSGKADLNLALGAILFGAAGTAGQRCTSIRRAIVHHSIYGEFFDPLKTAYSRIAESKIGDPRDEQTLVGPLIDKAAFANMQKALAQAKREGGEIHFGRRVLAGKYPHAFYAEPALVKIARQTDIVRRETFAPVLYVMPYETLEQAMEIHNGVAQGLSSAIFTTDLREAEFFRRRSDCGIANVNIGTSGAEIGGAFGGEKETGGGRESGSDAWKNYMRRQTGTLYYGTDAPELAQGIKFDAR